MRKQTTFISCLALVAISIVFVQVPVAAHDGKHPDAPNPSPNATASQVVGFTKVSLSYGRPGVKDRTIWGELVPYNGGDPRPWAGGANGSTIITFDEDVKINGNAVAAGSYGLFWIPAEDEWTIILNSDSSQFGIMKYTPEKDVLRITAAPEEAEYQEWLSYDIQKTGELTADLNLHWERITIRPEGAEYQEWLSYDFEKTGELTANLNLHWESLKVGFTIEGPDHRTEKHD